MEKEKRIYINGEETRYTINIKGQVKNLDTGKYLKGTFRRNEYHSFYLMLNGKQHTVLGHKLVAEAFLKNEDPEHYTIIDHIDRDKHNNCLENLRWTTPSENALNAEKTSKQKVKYLSSEELLEFNGKTIKEFPNYMVNKEGTVVNKLTSRILSPSDRCGYKRVALKDASSGKTSLRSVHRLVYETFMGEIPEKLVVDHIDGDKSNNCLENLRVVSQSENMYNAFKNGHKGQKPIYQYSKDNKFIKKYDSIQAAADDMNVTHAAIRSAAARKGTSCGYRWYYEEF